MTHDVYVTAEELSFKKAVAKTVIAIICRAEETGEATEEEVFCASSSLYLKTQVFLYFLSCHTLLISNG